MVRFSSHFMPQAKVRQAVLGIISLSMALGAMVVVGCQPVSDVAVQPETAEQAQPETAKQVVAAIVPHHLVAESIIDRVVAAVAVSQPNIVIVVSPDHWGSTQQKFTTSAQAEYAEAPVATEWRDQLLNMLPDEMFGTDDDSLAREHGLSNIIPFIRQYLPEAKILPVIIAQPTSQNQIEEFIAALGLTGNGVDTIAVIASSDFSHYLPFEAAELHDVKTRRVLSQFAFDQMPEVEVDCWQCLYMVAQVAKNYDLPFTELIHDNAASIEQAVDKADETTSYVGAIYEFGRTSTEYNRVSMLLVGDIMLGRYVETLMNSRGANYPFAGVAQLLRGLDLVAGNLEGPIPRQHAQTPNGEMRFSFREEFADVLRQHLFTDVTLANNHMYDQGAANYEYTGEVLAKVGINSFGHPTEESAEYVLRQEVNGQPLTMIGFNAFGTQFDRAAALETTRAAAQDNSRFTVVFVHWGIEYSLRSNAFQQDLAHDLVDAGADLIIGAHPHVVQEIEVYQNVPIFYSLGNFIFDQYFSQDTQEELAVGIELSESALMVRLFPLASVNSQPALMPLEQARPWLVDLAARSAPELEDSIKRGMIYLSR